MIAKEEQPKIKTISIHNRYITKEIEFKMERSSIPILDMSYKLLAANGAFSSIPIRITLEEDILYPVGELRHFLNILADRSMGDITIVPMYYSNIDTLIFERGETDDLDRENINMSYKINDNILDGIDIPIDTLPIILLALIKILEDKDIIDETIKEEAKDEEEESEESKDEEVEVGQRDGLLDMDTRGEDISNRD